MFTDARGRTSTRTEELAGVATSTTIAADGASVGHRQRFTDDLVWCDRHCQLDAGHSSRVAPQGRAAPPPVPFLMRHAYRLVVFAAAIALSATAVRAQPGAARYFVRFSHGPTPAVSIVASLPATDSLLRTDPTRPGDIAGVDTAGWSAIVRIARVTDATGARLTVTRSGDSGWVLMPRPRGRIEVQYELDLAALQAAGWPAPREAAFADSTTLTSVGRLLFVFTSATTSAVVRARTPPGWRMVTPWARSGTAHARSVAELTENMIAFSRGPVVRTEAAGFKVAVVPLGDWANRRSEVKDVVASFVRQYVSWLRFRGEDRYVVVLLPVRDRGAESFRQSFALTVPESPTSASRGAWGNMIAHELFHYWNGWRLRGADYAASQWFQEGFTEYAANLAMVRSGLENGPEFRARLGVHMDRAATLATSLEAPGTHKGPPLYSGGALIAFAMDVMIRDATHDRMELGDVLVALWRDTRGGQRAWNWPMLKQALDTTAPLDWQAFHDAHIAGRTPVPMTALLAKLGQRAEPGTDGKWRVVEDGRSNSGLSARWNAMLAER